MRRYWMRFAENSVSFKKLLVMAPGKVINFSAGPAKISEEVLKRAQNELLDWDGSGISVLEMSHRSPEFTRILNNAEQLLREVMNIPDNYKVLFLSGGAIGQFSGIPLNILRGGTADYVVTGAWSEKAAKEITKYGTVNLVLPKLSKYTGIPDISQWKLDPDAAYLLYCDNETIDGVEFNFVPETNGVPLVCDMSSNILTRPVDVSKYGLIFAGAQKNAGCGGITIVIVRSDLIGHAHPTCPSFIDYKQQAENSSLLNTPSTYSIYITGLVLEWVKKNGGVEGMAQLSAQKSKLIYDIIDSSDGFYFSAVHKKYRSRINVTFRIGGESPSEELEKAFLQEAKQRNMIELKGHRTVGGLRASLYNAMTLQETEQLAQLMKDFMAMNKK